MAFSFRLGACLAILAALLHVTVATAPKTGPSSCQKTEFWCAHSVECYIRVSLSVQYPIGIRMAVAAFQAVVPQSHRLPHPATVIVPQLVIIGVRNKAAAFLATWPHLTTPLLSAARAGNGFPLFASAHTNLPSPTTRSLPHPPSPSPGTEVEAEVEVTDIIMGDTEGVLLA